MLLIFNFSSLVLPVVKFVASTLQQQLTARVWFRYESTQMASKSPAILWCSSTKLTCDLIWFRFHRLTLPSNSVSSTEWSVSKNASVTLRYVQKKMKKLSFLYFSLRYCLFVFNVFSSQVKCSTSVVL